MKKITLESFCRDNWNALAYGREWTHAPFRFGRYVGATNGHLLVWRPAVQADTFPRLNRKRSANVARIVTMHPGRPRCLIPWPTTPAEQIERESRVVIPMGKPYTIMAVYRDRIARFGKTLHTPVLYAKPRTPRSERGKIDPVPFTVGPYLGLLMPMRTTWPKP